MIRKAVRCITGAVTPVHWGGGSDVHIFQRRGHLGSTKELLGDPEQQI